MSVLSNQVLLVLNVRGGNPSHSNPLSHAFIVKLTVPRAWNRRHGSLTCILVQILATFLVLNAGAHRLTFFGARDAERVLADSPVSQCDCIGLQGDAGGSLLELTLASFLLLSYCRRLRILRGIVYLAKLG